MNAHKTLDPPENAIPRQCTATSKRSGARCRKSAMKERLTCSVHGGGTPRGVESPHFRHGRYSKAMPFRLPPTGNTRLSDVPRDRLCGAKTRAGTACKNWSRRWSGRCRMHGGSSPISIGSASFRHGWYSKYQPWVGIRRRVEERERRERRVAAIMKEIRAQRAEMEAQRLAEREKNWIDWERMGQRYCRLRSDSSKRTIHMKNPMKRQVDRWRLATQWHQDRRVFVA